jgi:spore coat protein CotH
MPDDSWIFSHSTIHELELTVDEAGYLALESSPYEFVEASLSFDGQLLPSVGLRLRGKYGSLRSLGGKPKFKIDFNRYVEDQRFWGLEALSLNNGAQDCGLIKEVFAYQVFDAADLVHQRTGYAWVRLNGADMGLYGIVETPDDRMMERAWPGHSDGNLYDGKYITHDSGYTLLDLVPGLDVQYPLEEGTDVGNADLIAVSAAIAASRGTPDFYATTDALIDWPQMHRYWAVEEWVGQLDGYFNNTNNNRVYFDPEDGRLEMIPWDLDNTFYPDGSWGRDWLSPLSALGQACLADSSCAWEQREAVGQLLADLDVEALSAELAALDALTLEAAWADPRKECTNDSVSAYRAEVAAWVVNREATVRARWGL